MTEEEFHRIQVLMKTKYGIDLNHKKEIVQGRLDNYIQRRGYRTYEDYLNALDMDASKKLEEEMVNLLTTNHTYFMREFEHFECLKKDALPWVRKVAEKNHDIRIWCGASSTGEEPYMIAMMIRDFLGLEYQQWDAKILATDVSTQVLRKAVNGVYTKEQIAELPVEWKRRYMMMSKDGNMYRIKDDIKSEVIFRQFNLMDDFPFKKKMHIIFLRNVMIYFDNPTKRKLLRKIYDLLEPGGYLFIGKTETIDRRTVPFQMISPSIFRKPLHSLERIQKREALVSTQKMIAIGASTGGTEATAQVLRGFDKNVPGIVIVQHMPPGFTRAYAKRLDEECKIKVKEAETGDEVKPGMALIAPGGNRHMKLVKVNGNYQVVLKNGPKINGHCPSVDALFESVAKEAGKNAIGIILTGMGSDGARGLLAMKKSGAHTIGQDESTSVVYGMPKEAYHMGAVEYQVQVPKIAGKVYSILKNM